MRCAERHQAVVLSVLLAASLITSVTGAVGAPQESVVAKVVEGYRYEAVPKGNDSADSRESIDMHIVTFEDRVEYSARIVTKGENEQVRVVTDRQGRVVFASRNSGSGSAARVTKIWHDAGKVYVRDAGGSGGKAKTIEMPTNRLLAVDASLLILLRSFPFDRGQEWEVFMVDFSGFSTTVAVRQAGVETVETPAGAFQCYRMEVVVDIPILKPKITYWIAKEAPHFLVSHQGKRGPFTSSYITTLVGIDRGLHGPPAP